MHTPNPAHYPRPPQNLIKCPACSTLCRPGSLCATCAQARVPRWAHLQQSDLIQKVRPPDPAGRPQPTAPGPVAGGVAAEQRPLPLLPEPFADGSRPASTHYGPFLMENLLVDAFRYNAGRSTPYAASFAQGLAELWPRLPLRTRQQLQVLLQELFEADDAARAHNPFNEELPLGMDSARQAWEKVRQAWQATGAG